MMHYRGTQKECLDRLSLIVELCRTPMTAQQIADYFHVSKPSISQAIKRVNQCSIWLKKTKHGIKTPFGWTPLFTTIRDCPYEHPTPAKAGLKRKKFSVEDPFLARMFGFTEPVLPESKAEIYNEIRMNELKEKYSEWNPATYNVGRHSVSGNTLSMLADAMGA